MGDSDRFRDKDEGSLEMGVILGNRYPGVSTAPAEEEDVLLPQLELRLPVVHCASSRPRTVNSLVNSNALVT